jgi:hypothetical protein
MHKYQRKHSLGFISLEGYIAAKLFASIAESVPGELTRENFMQTMQQTGSFDLGGVVLHFGEKNHQGMTTVELSTIYPTIEQLKTDE